eukprot:tig00001128_g7172.t1
MESGAGTVAEARCRDGSGPDRRRGVRRYSKPDRYLSGNFKPVEDEVAAKGLRVIGELPEDLNGTYVRNGANARFPPESIGRPLHWFEGDGMLHATTLRSGKASYRNRFVRTPSFEMESRAGRPLFKYVLAAGGLTFLANTVSNAVRTGLPAKQPGNTSVLRFGGRLLALAEDEPPVQVDAETMETLGVYTFDGQWTGPFTAHPKLDPRTGELITFGYNPQSRPHIRYAVFSPGGKKIHELAIDLPACPLMHDTAATPSHTIIFDLPFNIRPERVLSGRSPIGWDHGRPSRFGIMPRFATSQSQIRWFEASGCHVWHSGNAWEEGGRVRGILWRWEFDLATGRTSEGPLCEHAMEFPQINGALAMQNTRYMWSVRTAPGGPKWDGYLKHDLRTGETVAGSFGPSTFGGEAVFVPRRNPAGEDDGYLVNYVHDEGSGVSELRVADAREPSREPLARVILPQRVPYGFHGTFIPA